MHCRSLVSFKRAPASSLVGVSAASLLLASVSGCFFDFSRDADFVPGEVRGVAVVEDAPVSFARSHIVGDPTFAVTGADGVFRHVSNEAGTYVLRAFQDTNQDSWPERGAVLSFSLVEQAHAEGVFGQAEPVLTSVDLGNVTLRGTVSLAGQVVDENGDPAPGAKVVVAREIRATTLSAEPVVVTAGVEAQVATDVSGQFRLAAVLPGAFYVVAIDTSGDGVRASNPRVVESVGLEDLRFDGADALQLQDAAQTQREVIAKLTPSPAAGVTVSFEVVPAARGLVPISTDVDGAAFTLGEASLGALAVGQYNVVVRTSDGRQSIPQRQLVLPGSDAVRWGTIELLEDLCSPGDDCDGDGIRGLPINLLSACRQTCAEGAPTCVVDDEEYDCEDDGDGQIDSTEPDCYGVGAGTDCDSDGICDWEDEDPFCRPDDTACDPTAVENNCGRLLPPDPVDGGPADGGVDAGPTDGGPDDGGPNDGGGPIEVDGGDAGLLDAGPDGGTDGGAPDAGVDAGPPPDFGIGFGLIVEGSEWTRTEEAVAAGDHVVVHLRNFNGDAVAPLAKCPGDPQALRSEHAFATFDPLTGDCVAATYLTLPLGQNDRVASATLLPHPDGAVAAVAYVGDVNVSNGFGLGPFSEGVAFILLREDTTVSLLNDYEIFGGQGVIVNSLEFAGRDDGSMVAMMSLPDDGVVNVAGAEASNVGGADLFFVSFDSNADTDGSRTLQSPNQNFFLAAFAATSASMVALKVESFFGPAFAGTAYEMPPNTHGVVLVDTQNESVVPQLVVVEGADEFAVGRTDANTLLIAASVDRGAHLITIDANGNVGLGQMGFSKGGPFAPGIGQVVGGIPQTYRIASLPDADFAVVSYSTAGAGSVIVRVPLDDLSDQTVLTSTPAETGVLKLSAANPSLVVYRVGSDLRTIPATGGSPSLARTVDPASHIALSPDGSQTYFTAGRGGSGYTVDRIATDAIGETGTAHQSLFEVASSQTPRLATNEAGDTLYIFTSTSFYEYDLVTEPIAPTLIFSHTFTGAIPADMAVFEESGTLVLSSPDGESAGITVSPLDEWERYGGFSQVRSVGPRLPSGLVFQTPFEAVSLGYDRTLGVVTFDASLVATTTTVGEGASLTPFGVSESNGTVVVTGIVNDEREDKSARVVVDGVEEEVFPTGDHPLRSRFAQGFALEFEADVTGELEAQNFWVTNGLGEGEMLAAARTPTHGVVLLGDHYPFTPAQAFDALKLGRHSVEMASNGISWLWRPVDDKTHPQEGLGQRVERVSLDAVGAVHAVQMGAGPLRNERALVVAATGGTLGAAQGCAHATADESALLVAILDDDGGCVTSFAIVGEATTGDQLKASAPVVLDDGTMLLSISTPASLEFQSSDGGRTPLLTVGATSVSAVIRIDALLGTSAAVADSVTGDAVGLGRLTLAPTREQTLWTLPFSGEATLAGGSTFGDVDINNQFAVFFADGAGPFDFYWESFNLTAGTPVTVESAVILPSGDYALALGPINGVDEGTVFDHVIDVTNRATVLFHPSPALSPPTEFRLDHFVGAASPLSLGYDLESSRVTATGTFSGSLDVTDGENTVSATGDGLNTAFMIALPTFDTTPSPPDPASEIAVVNPDISEGLTMLPHQNARSGAAMMAGIGAATLTVDVGFRDNDEVTLPNATAPFALLIGGTFDRLLLHSQALTVDGSVSPLAFSSASDQGAWMVGRANENAEVGPENGSSPRVTLEAGDLWTWHIQRSSSP